MSLSIKARDLHFAFYFLILTNKSYHYTFNYFPLQYRNNNILARQRVQSYSKYCHYNEIDVIQYKLKCSSTFTLWSLLVIYGLVCSSGLINHNCKPVSFYSPIYIYIIGVMKTLDLHLHYSLFHLRRIIQMQ